MTQFDELIAGASRYLHSAKELLGSSSDTLAQTYFLLCLETNQAFTCRLCQNRGEVSVEKQISDMGHFLNRCNKKKWEGRGGCWVKTLFSLCFNSVLHLFTLRCPGGTITHRFYKPSVHKKWSDAVSPTVFYHPTPLLPLPSPPTQPLPSSPPPLPSPPTCLCLLEQRVGLCQRRSQLSEGWWNYISGQGK